LLHSAPSRRASGQEIAVESEGKLERAFSVIRSLNMTNILIFALLVVIAIPAYFAYRFMSDVGFRREFMSSAVILEQHVPCIVLEGHRYGSQVRHSIFVVYGLDGRNEKLLGLRAPEAMNSVELTELCKRVVALSEEIQAFRKKEAEEKSK
jgi:hypothetical protein